MKKGTSVVWLGAAMVIAAALAPWAWAASVGSTVSDSWITAKTKLSLAADGRVKGRQVEVDTKNGRVILSGKVDTAESKAAAGEIAEGIDDVKGVKNDLQVVDPSRREAVDDKDEVVTERVQKRFSKDSALREADIDVTTNAGVVSLTGEVPSLITSSKASWEAWKTSGVKSVKNRLAIEDETEGY